MMILKVNFCIISVNNILRVYKGNLLAQNNKIIPQSTEVLIFLRRMKKSKQDNYNNSVEKLIQQNPEKKFTVAILESAKEDAHNDALIRSWAKKFNNVTTFSPIFNPLELYSEFMEGASYCVVAPQYHVIITAHAAGISFMPIVYDNKVRQVLQEINPTVEPYSIETLKTEDIQLFIDQEHKRVI